MCRSGMSGSASGAQDMLVSRWAFLFFFTIYITYFDILFGYNNEKNVLFIDLFERGDDKNGFTAEKNS